MKFIAGSGRSGTTWVLDALATANGLRTVFEPLNPYVSKLGAQYANRYLTGDDEAADLRKMFRSAATGELHTLWTHYRVVPARLKLRRQFFRSAASVKRWVRDWRIAGQRVLRQPAQRNLRNTLVKCVRANLLLDWVHVGFEARTVLLIRHPGAVVESQLRSVQGGWNPFPVLDRYRQDERLMRGPLQHFVDQFKRDLTPAQALTLVWCVQNLVPLGQALRNGYTVVCYEELLERPETEWPRVAGALGLDRLPAGDVLEAPSQQAAARWDANVAPAEGYAQDYGRWHDRLGAHERAQVQGMLDAVGVSFYRLDEVRPDIQALAAAISEPAGQNGRGGVELRSGRFGGLA